MEALAGTQLYPITDRNLSGLSHADQVATTCRRRCKAGAAQGQDKFTPSEFYAQAEAAIRVARQLRNQSNNQ